MFKHSKGEIKTVFPVPLPLLSNQNEHIYKNDDQDVHEDVYDDPYEDDYEDDDYEDDLNGRLRGRLRDPPALCGCRTRHKFGYRFNGNSAQGTRQCQCHPVDRKLCQGDPSMPDLVRTCRAEVRSVHAR